MKDKKQQKAVSIGLACIKELSDYSDNIIEAIVSKVKNDVDGKESNRVIKGTYNTVSLFIKSAKVFVKEKEGEEKSTLGKDDMSLVANALSVFQQILKKSPKTVDSFIAFAGEKPVKHKRVNKESVLSSMLYLLTIFSKQLKALYKIKPSTKKEINSSYLNIPDKVFILAGKLDDWLDVRTGGGGQSNSDIRKINNQIEEIWDKSRREIEKCRKLPEGEQRKAMNKVRKTRDAQIEGLEKQKRAIHEEQERKDLSKSVDSGATKLGKKLFKGTGKAVCDTAKLYAKGAIQSVKNMFYVATLPVAVASLGVGLAYDGVKAAGRAGAKAIRGKK